MPLLCQQKDKRYRKEPRTFDKSVPPKVNLVGQRFGKLIVVSWAGIWNQKNFWICECDCGDPSYNPVITETRCLRSGNTTSCGCKKRKHGMSKTRLHQIWLNMIRRCTEEKNKSYYNYGGRGITVCDRWQSSFENFYGDMGEPPESNYTLDRINNNAGYSPENCRWASYKEQGRNTRANRLVIWRGQTKTLSEWADDPLVKELGVSAHIIGDRLNKGWSTNSAMTTPPFPGKMITYQGETLTMMEWSRRLGTDKTNIVSKRIRRGWSVEDAVSTPLGKSRHSI
jgi:hypothetical protein